MLLIIGAMPSHSQDVIILKNGTESKVLIKSIEGMEVLFKNTDLKDTTTYSFPKSEIYTIRFADGRIINYNNREEKYIEKRDSVISENEQQVLFNKGYADAYQSYSVQYETWIINGVSGIILGPAGVITPVAFTFFKPSKKYMRSYESKLMKNDKYFEGFSKGANRNKNKQVWTAYGYGALAWGCIVVSIGLLALSAAY